MPLSIGDMGSLAIAFVIVAVIVSVGATILVGVQDSQTNTTAGRTLAYNITADALDGQESLGDWLPTIATVLGAAVILGIVYYLRA